MVCSLMQPQKSGIVPGTENILNKWFQMTKQMDTNDLNIVRRDEEKYNKTERWLCI